MARVEHNIDEARADLQRFEREIEGTLEEILGYASTRVGARGAETYMRDAKGEGRRRPPEDSGPLRILSGRLARAVRGARGRQADTGGQGERTTSLTLRGAKAELKITISVPYAAAHEYGFSGSVRMPEHQRTITEAFGEKLPAPVTVTVEAHSRDMNIEARSYIRPALEEERPKIEEHAVDTLMQLFEGSAGGNA